MAYGHQIPWWPAGSPWLFWLISHQSSCPYACLSFSPFTRLLARVFVFFPIYSSSCPCVCLFPQLLVFLPMCLFVFFPVCSSSCPCACLLPHVLVFIPLCSSFPPCARLLPNLLVFLPMCLSSSPCTCLFPDLLVFFPMCLSIFPCACLLPLCARLPPHVLVYFFPRWLSLIACLSSPLRVRVFSMCLIFLRQKDFKRVLEEEKFRIFSASAWCVFFYHSYNRLARWKDYVGIGEQWGLQGGFVEVDGCAKEAALWHPWESSLESPAVSFVFVFVFVSGAPRGIWANKTC